MTSNQKCPNCGKSSPTDDETAADSSFMCPSCNYENGDAIPSFSPGQKIGDYSIIETIGLGGMGEVFLATQVSLKRNVALKVLMPSLATNREYLKRFFKEVRILAKIEHPNVVQAIEAGIDNNTCFFSMTFIPGEDMEHRLDRGEVYDELEALKVVLEVAKTLKYVWEKHTIIHRDIKPSNIMISTESGEVKLMDLGISKLACEDSELTVKGMMVGSPNYISPEQARAEEDIDFRADMYSLGATYYHFVTGKLPYRAENSVGVIARHISDPIPDVRKDNPKITKKSKLLIDRFLAKKREDRYDNWDEAIEDIELIIMSQGGGPSTTFIQNYDIDKNNSIFTAEKINSLWTKCLKLIGLKAGTVNFKKISFKLNWHRLIALLIVLMLFLAAFYSVVQKSIREQKMLQAKKHYESIMKLVDSTPIEKYSKLIASFEQVQMMDNPLYSQKAKEAVDFLRIKKNNSEKDFQSRLREDAFDFLHKGLSRFETRGNYKAALKLLRYYQKSGKYRSEVKFRREIKIKLEHFEQKLKEKKDGLLPD